MHRPPGPPPQRPLSMNPLNFNRVASGQGSGGAAGAGVPSPSAYNYLPRPSPGAAANNASSAAGSGASASGASGAGANSQGSTPFNRGFPFGASNLPPHLAGFAGGQGSGTGQGAGATNSSSLNMNEFPALGGGASFGSNASGGPNAGSGGNGMSYANSTASGNTRGGIGGTAAGGNGTELSTDDFPALSDGFVGGGGGANGAVNLAQAAAVAAAAAAANQEQASAAATLQHQRLAREQNQSQTLNAARGGFGEPDRNYTTKVGMQQPPGMTAAAQNWFSANFGGAGTTGSTAAAALGLNGFAQAAAAAAAAAGSMDEMSASAAGQQAAGLLLQQRNPNAPGGQPSAIAGNAGQAGAGSSAPQHAKTPAQQVLTSPADRFGLAGLLNIIKMQDPDLTMLAMGSDLQTLGLNLNSQDSLSSTFVSPWSDNNTLASSMQSQVEPEFHLPSCYNVQAPPPPQSKIASFSDETLFFIFYSTPRDVLQEIAAQELYNRNWRFYRGGLNLWLTKEENVQPTHKDLRAEKGVYIFWDPATWSKVSREFVLAYDALEERSMGVSPAQLLANNAHPQQQPPPPQQPGNGQGAGQGAPASQHPQPDNQTPGLSHQQPQSQQAAQVGA